MPASTKNPGFVSQRKFAKYMKAYHSSCMNSHVSDPVSRELYNSQGEKGRKGEFLVSGILRDMGYKTEVLNGYDGCDVMLLSGQKWLKIEVKTSTFSNSGYQFHRIKPNNFDMIALVLAGIDGTTIQIGCANAKKFIVRYATWVVRDSAFSMHFGRMRKHSKMNDKQKDIWFDFTKQNMERILDQM